MQQQQQVFFLSGIARSGSTLLGSILNQNPDIHVTPTSPLLDLFCLVEGNLQGLTQQYTFDLSQVSPNIHSGLTNSFYKHINKPYIIDKHRGWPKNVDSIKKTITPNPKIICTYRPIAENIVSFLKLINKDPNNSVDATLKQRRLEINVYNRAMLLWNEYSNDPFYSMMYGLEHDRNNILVVPYDDIVSDAPAALNSIYKFLEIPSYDKHHTDNIHNTCAEAKDDAWGFKGLHDINTKLEKTSDDPLTVLGNELYDKFAKINEQLERLI
jgi:sulfotransferase